MEEPVKEKESESMQRSASNVMIRKNNSKTTNGDKKGPLQRFRRRKRSSSEPPPKRHRFVEDHYRVDPQENIVLPGVPKHDDDWARDSHDFANLVVLIPVVALNVMNWNWDILLDRKKTVQEAWTGEWFDEFMTMSMFYFVGDLIWVMVIPRCVKSPGTIISHHIATLIYLLLPFMIPETRWLMGACMSVEINTWFLIARRVFNKQGFPPWVIDLPPFLSLRIRLISIFFYCTWIPIRCILYPYLLQVLFITWKERSIREGSYFNVILCGLPLQSVFVILNYKWTYDLVVSKIRYWRKQKGKQQQQRVLKGL